MAFVFVGIGLPVLVLGFVSLAETARANEHFEFEKQNKVNYTICHRSSLVDMGAVDCIYEPVIDGFMPYKIMMGGTLTFFGALVIIEMAGRKEPQTTPKENQVTDGAPFK